MDEISGNLEEEVRRAVLILDPEKMSFDSPNPKSLHLVGKGIFHDINTNLVERVYGRDGNLLWENRDYMKREGLSLDEKYRGLQIEFSYLMNYVWGDGKHHRFKALITVGSRQKYLIHKSFPYELVKAIFSAGGELIWEP